MKVTVISASPKGDASITFHTVLWIQKNAPQCTFETFHIGRSRSCRESAYASMLEADIVLFCYPVYTFIAPARLHEFIAYIKEAQSVSKGSGQALGGKAYAQVTTSKHFYDTTAHAWLCDNCTDLGMSYLGGLSADMDDLLALHGRKEALDFWKLALWRHASGIAVPVARIETKAWAYADSNPVIPSESEESHTELAGKKLTWMTPSDPIPAKPVVEDKIAVVASLKEGDSELLAMIRDFASLASLPVEVFNVETYPFKGSCISCFSCAATGKCIYTDRFDSYLRGRILTARAIVYAFRVQDHSMGVRMKIYDDRQFCNGHRTVTMGMPVGFIVAGDLGGEENLRTLMKARADVGGNFMAGIANDRSGVEALAGTVDLALAESLSQPRMFLGVGGMKIFRDLIWIMQGLMRADHRFFKSHGQYDFPQKRRGDMIKMYLVGALMNSPTLKKKAASQIAEGMIAPYRKAIGTTKETF